LRNGLFDGRLAALFNYISNERIGLFCLAIFTANLRASAFGKNLCAYRYSVKGFLIIGRPNDKEERPPCIAED
jgi:hypothetical protein